MMNKPQMPGAAQRTVLQKPERGQGATARAEALSARAGDVIRGPRRPRNGAPAVGQAVPAPQQPALPPRLQAAIAGGRMSEDQARQRAMVNAPQYRTAMNAAMNAAGGAGMPAQARDWSAPTGDQSYGGSNGGGQPTLNGPPMAGQGQIPDELRMGMGGANGPQEMLRQRLGQVNGGGLQAPPMGDMSRLNMNDVARMDGGGYQAQPSPLASVFMPQGQGQGGMDLDQLRAMISRYQGPQAQQAAIQGAVSSYRY